MDFTLSDEHQQVIETIRDFGETEVWAGPSLAYGRGRFWLAATFGFGLTDDASLHRGRILFGLTL